MRVSNFEKYALTEEEINQVNWDMEKLISAQRLSNMTNAFDLASFFETESKIAVVLITPNQVVISYGSRILDHTSLYSYMANCVSKKCLENPMIELRCVSNSDYGICTPILYAKSVIPQEMKEVLTKIHDQFNKIRKDVMLFDMEEIEDQIKYEKLWEVRSIQQENIFGIPLSDYKKNLETENNFSYILRNRPKR